MDRDLVASSRSPPTRASAAPPAGTPGLPPCRGSGPAGSAPGFARRRLATPARTSRWSCPGSTARRRRRTGPVRRRRTARPGALPGRSRHSPDRGRGSPPCRGPAAVARWPPRHRDRRRRSAPTERRHMPRRRGHRSGPNAGPAAVSRDEVLGLWVAADDGVGRLFGVELETLAHRHADPVPTQQLHDFGVVGQVRAGRVAP